MPMYMYVPPYPASQISSVYNYLPVFLITMLLMKGRSDIAMLL